MKIANIILTSQNGGAEQVFIDYSVIFKKLGHEIVAVTKQDAPYINELLKFGITARKITNHFGYHDFLAIKKLQGIFEEEKIEVVFAHAGRAMVIARKAIKKIKNRKIFLIAVNHSMNVKRSIGSDIILSVNKQIFYKTIDGGQSADKSFVIANAVELTDEIPPQVNLKKKEQIILGIIGRLDAAKGFRYAIEALSFLKNSDKKFILKIAGLGKEEKFLRDKVKRLKLEDRVEFLGWMKGKKDFYDSIDILIFPSIRETFGLVVIEGIKFHKPIISSNSDGPSEILRDGIDGLLFNVKQSDEKIGKEIADKIERIVTEENLANNLIKNSFIRLHEKFSYKILEKNLVEILGEVRG